MKIKLTENQLQRILKEMRFDGKSTGLFSEEEPVTELYKSTYKNAAAKAVEEKEDELAIKFLKHSNIKGIPDDIDADGIHDSEDDELAVDRFDIEQRIKSTMNEYFAEVPKDKYNKWDRLERDVDSCIRSIIETHKDNFGYDSYGVIDAIYQIMDGMFQRV